MTSTSFTPREALALALAKRSEATVAELAEETNLGKSTANKYLAAMERDGAVVRTVGGRAGGRRVADRWALAEPIGDVVPISAAANKGASASASVAAEAKTADGGGSEATEPEVHEPSGPRLSRGELSTLVLDYLRDHAGEAIGPSAIAKALERSAGAVGNACQRLDEAGTIRLVSSSPRRYQLADDASAATGS